MLYFQRNAVGRPRKHKAAKKTGATEKEKEGNGTEEVQAAIEDGKSQSGKVMVSWLLLFDISLSAKSIRVRYTSVQKAKVARYAQFHGSRAAARHYSIHHKNAQWWLGEGLDNVRVTKRSKRKNETGGGRKLSYPKDIDNELLQWVMEKREEQNVPVSKQAIRLKAL